jgi:hypothetical protein
MDFGPRYDWLQVPVFVAIGALVLAAIVYSLVAAAKRRQALLAVAQRTGLLFEPGDCYGLPERYEATTVCGEGHSKSASNAITGDLGEGRVSYFDYKYTTGSGKNQTTHYYSVCVFESAFFWRRLFLRPENFLDKAAALVGFDDINLDNAEFNRTYFVKCEDKKFAYDVLSQRVMQFFIARRGISMEMLMNAIVFYRSGTIRPEEVEALIRDAASFTAMLPNYLRTDSQAVSEPARPRPGVAMHPDTASAAPRSPQQGFVPDKQATHQRPAPPEE